MILSRNRLFLAVFFMVMVFALALSMTVFASEALADAEIAEGSSQVIEEADDDGDGVDSIALLQGDANQSLNELRNEDEGGDDDEGDLGGEPVEPVEPVASEDEKGNSSAGIVAASNAPETDEANEAGVDLVAAEMTAADSGSGSSALADGVYTIASSILNSARMEIGGASQANGARTQVYGDNWTAAQRWYISNLGNGFYKIVNVASGKALDVSGGKVGNGARVQQYAWNGTKAQQWKIESTSAGYLLYSALSSQYVLDLAGAKTANGTVVQLYQSNGTKAQRWSLAAIKPELANGLYTMAPQSAPGKTLDVSGGSVYNSANVQQYQSNGTPAQSFYLSYNSSNGYYTVIASSSGLVLDVSGGSNSNGANVQLYTPNGTSAQKWAIAKNSDGSFTLHSAIGGRSLDVSGASTANGANVQTWASNGTKAQRWSIASAGAWSIAEGVYNIVTSVNQANSLAVAGASRANSANVQTLATSVTNWAQKWVITKGSDGYYTLRNMNSRMALSVADSSKKSGTNVRQNTLDGSELQLWRAELTAGGIVFHSKVDNSIVLDISGANANAGANVQAYSSNGTAAQKFRIRSVSAIDNNTMFTFVNLESGKALDIAGASTANGAALQLYEPNGTGAQKFRAISAGSNVYYLQNVTSSKYVDVDTSSKSKLQQWDGKSGTDKQWALSFDMKTCTFTVKSQYTGTYLDGASGALSLKPQSSSDAQRFALQPSTFRLYLDAGHIVGKAGYDSGATGNGYTEAQLTADLTDRIAKICRDEYGLDVVDGKTFGISYEKRTGKAVELGCTAFLSIHFNAGGGSGYMSIVGGPERRNADSPTLTNIMHSHLGQAMSGLRNNGVSTRGDLAVTNDSRIAATLLEVAYIDNSYDMQVYNSRRDAVAREIAKGVLEASTRSEFN